MDGSKGCDLSVLIFPMTDATGSTTATGLKGSPHTGSGGSDGPSNDAELILNCVCRLIFSFEVPDDSVGVYRESVGRG